MSQNFNPKEIGRLGEKEVAKMLEQDNFEVLAQNYRKRFGEVDIIAKKKDLIIFVEVKTRTKVFIPLSELIVKSKQKKIINTVISFIAEHNLNEKTFRFDIALVKNNELGFDIQYIPNAFSQESCDEKAFF